MYGGLGTPGRKTCYGKQLSERSLETPEGVHRCDRSKDPVFSVRAIRANEGVVARNGKSLAVAGAVILGVGTRGGASDTGIVFGVTPARLENFVKDSTFGATGVRVHFGDVGAVVFGVTLIVGAVKGPVYL